MPGVLTCHHRFSGVLEGGLDPQVAAYITDVRLNGLLQVLNIELDLALITVMMERWWPETRLFHLPYGKMTITIQDMKVIMRVPVDGLPMVGITHMSD